MIDKFFKWLIKPFEDLLMIRESELKDIDIELDNTTPIYEETLISQEEYDKIMAQRFKKYESFRPSNFKQYIG